MFRYLEAHGVRRWFPGFDILSLDADDLGRPGRLVELKSSGVNARTQTMTWNEWKSAQSSELRSVFYLYLVGNLRTDLGSAAPFLRAIRDPFSSLWAREVTETAPRRSIQLNVLEFDQAEELTLGVRGGIGMSVKTPGPADQTDEPRGDRHRDRPIPKRLDGRHCNSTRTIWRGWIGRSADARLRTTVYPRDEDVFRAFEVTPLEAVKAVIVGQDPYPNEGQACGLAFAVPHGAPRPRSLRLIISTLEKDCALEQQKPYEAPPDATLDPWPRAGMLLLNTALTVEAK